MLASLLRREGDGLFTVQVLLPREVRGQRAQELHAALCAEHHRLRVFLRLARADRPAPERDRPCTAAAAPAPTRGAAPLAAAGAAAPAAPRAGACIPARRLLALHAVPAGAAGDGDGSACRWKVRGLLCLKGRVGPGLVLKTKFILRLRNSDYIL